MPSRALVTGGGRGIGADIARELANAGWHVTVTAVRASRSTRSRREIGGTAVVGDVSKRADVERMIAAAGPIDLLVANAGIALWEDSWETDLDEWWHIFEVNVLGAYLTCRLALPGMIERGGGRIVITGSGASYLPGSTSGRVQREQGRGRALRRDAREAGGAARREGLRDQPRPRQHGHDRRPFPDDAPWTPPELAPQLVLELASGRFDALAGRYLHAEHDPPDVLESRIDRILAEDLNAIRLADERAERLARPSAESRSGGRRASSSPPAAKSAVPA